MNRDESALKRYRELANRSYMTGTYVYTDFLGIAEKSDLLSLEKELSHVGINLYGGYGEADRVIACFGREEDLLYRPTFPICCIHIKPVAKKFADELSHRDFLGALMNLGIERSSIGDIKVYEKEAYIFCTDTMAGYICENLSRVKHTVVSLSLVEGNEVGLIVDEEPKLKQITVSSVRADGIISKVYNLSRNEALTMFQTQKVYVNGRLSENNSGQVKLGDVINVRGYGKFRIASEPRDTRKGRVSMDVHIW